MVKKTIMLLAIALGVLAVSAAQPAYAYIDGWTLDLNAVIPGLGTHLNIDRLIASGTSSITQDFGGDGVFSNGDTFSEASWLQTISYWTEPGSPPVGEQLTLGLTTGSTTYKMYATSDNLTGYVYDVTSPVFSNAEFKYAFTGGNVGIYLDTDTDPSNGATNIAQLQVVSPSGGQGPAGFLGGAGPNGTTDLTMMFASAAPGVWKAGDMDFSTLPPGVYALGLVNTNNTVIGESVSIIENGFTASAFSEGKFNVDVIPEPATMLLFGLGAAGLAAFKRKKVS